MKEEVSLFAVGDLIFGTKNGEFYFEHTVKTLRKGDVVIGHLEVPYTLPYRDPEWMNALLFAGFNVVTLAGNHIYDLGPHGVKDTLLWLSRKNIQFTGAGMNLLEAKRPAIVERKGVKIGFLSYNCVGPRESWAQEDKAGCAYVKIITHYELDYACPGGPPTIYTFIEPESFKEMKEDIRKLKESCDVVIVSLHKGLVHIPAKIDSYERELSHGAIESGADLVLGHHAHILKGIEIYMDRVIFHGLGNFVTIVPELMVKEGQSSKSWAVRRREIFAFEPDPEYPLYPFHPEAIYTMIVKCLIKDNHICKVSYIPCIINKNAQPEIKGMDEEGKKVFDYVEKITKEASLNASFEWEGDEVVILKKEI